MQQAGNEALSALLDGEADDLELRRLLKSLDSDTESAGELLGQWQRYHLAQDVLHDRGVPVSDSLVSRISEQLELEEVYQAEKSRPASGSGWQNTVSKMAIAASVAAVFVVALQINPDPATPGATIANSEPVSQSPQQSSEFAPMLMADSAEMTVDPAAEARLRLFLEGISVDVSEPVVTEQIQDSPLFRLVNQIQD